MATIGPATATHETVPRSSKPAWTALGSTSRTARTTSTRTRGSCARSGGARPAARADRRPAGAEAADRRSLEAAARSRRRGDRDRRRPQAATASCLSPAVISDVLRPGPQRADRRRTRPAARRGGRGRPRPLHRRRRRRGQLAQGREPAGRPDPDPCADQKDIEDLEFALEPRRRLRRALVRPRGRGRPRAAGAHPQAARTRA